MNKFLGDHRAVVYTSLIVSAVAMLIARLVDWVRV